MSTAQLRNVGMYGLYVLVGALIAAGIKLGTELGGSEPINWRAVMEVFVVTFFGTASTAWAASKLPRFGSEQISEQVNTLQADGTPRSQMVVLSQEDAVAALAGQIGELTPHGRRLLLERLKSSLPKEGGS